MSTGVWITREVVEIERLLDEAQDKALTLGLKLRHHGEELQISGHGSATGLPRMLSSAAVFTGVADDLLSIYSKLEPLLEHAAHTVQHAAALITCQAEALTPTDKPADRNPAPGETP